MDMIKQLIDAIKQASAPKTSAYDTPAEVVRVEDGVAWVHIPGGVSETPVKLTINAKAGDIVQVRVGGGQAWLTGNASAPPTDDSTADRVAVELEEAKDAIFRAIQAVSILTRHLTVADRDGNVIADFDADQHLANIAGWTAEHGILSTVVDDPTVSTFQRYIELNALTGEITVQKREKSSGLITGDIVISKDQISFGIYSGGALWYRSSLSMAADGQRGTFYFDSGAPYGGQIGIANYDSRGSDLYTGISDYSSAYGPNPPISGHTITGALKALGDNVNAILADTPTRFNDSSIGSEGTPVPTGTNTTISMLTVDKGWYIFKGSARFAANANGRRNLHFATVGDGDEANRFATVAVAGSSDGTTTLQTTWIRHITSDNTSIYLVAYQTSGSTLKVTYPGIEALRISKS